MLKIFISFYLFIVIALVGLSSLLDNLIFKTEPENRHLENLAQVLIYVKNEDDIRQLNLASALQTSKIPKQQLALADSQQRLFEQQGYILSYGVEDTPFIYTELDPLHYLQIKVAHTERSPNQILWYRIIFFTLLAMLVALWTWPLWRDIKKLEKAARSVQPDGAIENTDLGASSSLNVISEAMASLSQQVRSLLNNQRELTSAVAHEFRTPLARLKFAMASQPDTQQKREMEEDLNELGRLTQEMLEFSQSEHHTPELSVAEIPIHEMLQSLLNALPPHHIERLQIENHCQPLLLNADGHFVERAVLNLLNNAVKYARQQVQVSAMQSASDILLMVEDDGPGIPADLREKIFDAFYRPDKSRTRDKGGAGLGLATVKRIQQWHHGKVWVEDSHLGGAKFVLSYPTNSQI